MDGQRRQNRILSRLPLALRGAVLAMAFLWLLPENAHGSPSHEPSEVSEAAEIIVVRTDIPADSAAAADTFRLKFRVNDTRIEPALDGNAERLGLLKSFLRSVNSDADLKITSVNFLGGASPEGTDRSNQALCQGRADALRRYMGGIIDIPDSLFTTRYTGSDWAGLAAMIEADPDVPCREATLALVRSIIADGSTSNAKRARLRGMCNGRAYRYILANFFPTLRTSRVIITTRRDIPAPAPVIAEPIPAQQISPVDEDTVFVAPAPADTVRPFYMDLRTNLLYDAALVPNIGVQFYLGRNISVIADWMYAWWSNDSRHRYWRIYGGDLGLRYWFGSHARRKPLTGHHIGIYGQILTYDFEFGDRGWMGGKPGGTLWDKMQSGGGIEYGFTLPIKPRLNIDFSLGIGYLGGIVHEYYPDDKGHYIREVTKKRRWWGPTKAEISLVWLIGRGNRNVKYEKGGDK